MMKYFRYIVFGSFIIWFAGFAMFNHVINHYIIDNNTKTSAIVVLTGGRYRLSKAIDLLNVNMADKLFISGVQKNISLSDLKRRKDINVQTKRPIKLGYNAKNTIGNAIESNTWLKQEKINSIRLVTSNYHLPRSVEEFKCQNPDLNIIVHPVFSDKVHKKWWKSWKSFNLLFVEYNKFLYVYIVNNLILRGAR